MKTVGIIGNPNCGKSTIFNALTGSKQYIGNWPGVTVEKKEGESELPGGEKIRVVDLPGVYSLTATSEDEKASLEYVLSHEAGLFINVLDATTLERNLYLTLLLCELEVPMIVVVTMMDVARQRNMEIELDHLAAHLGVPVIGINANNANDTARLLRELAKALSAAKVPTVRLDYGNELEEEIDILSSAVVKTAEGMKVPRRWVATRALEGDPLARRKLEAYHDMAPEVLDKRVERVTAILADPPDVELAEARYGIISGLVKDVVHIRQSKIYLSETIDRFVLNRFLGLPVFFAVMAGVFGLVSLAGGAPTEFFERIGRRAFIALPGALLAALRAPDWLHAVVAEGLGSALTVLFSFAPVVFCMFFALSILEDSGYMSRAAFLADRFMRWLGLPGKSFVPMLVGFGCSVPAIMATRALESKRDRMLTVFMVPFMSCGAKLPVYAAFAAAFSPEHPWRMMVALYLSGVALGTLSGLVLKRTLFRGEPAHFIMELPPYHMPRPKHILLHTWDRLVGFLWRAGKFIVPMMLALGILDSFDTGFRPLGGDRSEPSERSMLSSVGRAMTPFFEPIGVEKDNWPASVAVFTGLFAKESVVGTLNGLYGRNAGDAGDGTSAAVMRRHFPKGFHQAFAYLLFILLYVPCVGATAVVFKEIGKFHGAVFVAYFTLLGWAVATMYHAVAVSGSVAWFSVGCGILAAMFCIFRFLGKKRKIQLS